MRRKKKDDVTSEIELPKKKKEKKARKNKEIFMILYTFLFLFLLCIGNIVYFLVKDSKTVINNTYNKRADLLAKTIVRGEILSKDGEKLAYSVDNGDGTETRVYPFNSMFAHVVGRFEQAKTGLEANENFTMLTSSTNLFETIYHQLSGTKMQGDNIITTLDVNLQKVAYDALGNRKGAIVVMEPSTGKILAMVSKPDYDPNTVMQNWDKLIADEENNSALLNRATQGLYPPGSTFKFVTLLSYMRQDKNYNDFIFDCDGEAEFGETVIHCYKNKHHGKEDLKASFANSCNTAFATIGADLDLTSYRSLADSLLFNSPLPVKFNYKQSSFSMTAGATEHEIAQTVIGQGKTLMTPLHNAMLVSAIANGGNLMTPYLVDRVENYHGTVIKKNVPKLFRSLLAVNEAEELTEYMKAVVDSGTGHALRSSKYEAAGKTGTAEVGSDESGHAWFIGFAPVNQPEIAVSILVENAGAASEHAVPIAKKIFDTYFANKQ